MSVSSHILNFKTSAAVRTSMADKLAAGSYKSNMAKNRRGKPDQPPLWFLREWMAACDMQTQVQLMERTGWSKAKASELFNGGQDFNSKTLREAAAAFNARPWELLMHPDDAFALRKQEDALKEVADRRAGFRAEPDFSPVRKAG